MRPMIHTPKKMAAGAATPATARCKSLMAVYVPHFPASFKPEVAIHTHGEGDVQLIQFSRSP
jgi:hypothetical protein